jgi:hypothetical protein
MGVKFSMHSEVQQICPPRKSTSRTPEDPPLQYSQRSRDLPAARPEHRRNPTVQAFNGVGKGRDLIVCYCTSRLDLLSQPLAIVLLLRDLSRRIHQAFSKLPSFAFCRGKSHFDPLLKWST